jgi:hypothetical protein
MLAFFASTLASPALHCPRRQNGHGCDTRWGLGKTCCKPSGISLRPRFLLRDGDAYPGNGFCRIRAHLLPCRGVPGTVAEPDYPRTRRSVFLLDSAADRADRSGNNGAVDVHRRLGIAGFVLA